MTRPREFRDPAVIIEEVQERGCRGCFWWRNMQGMRLCISPDVEPHLRPSGERNGNGCTDYTHPDTMIIPPIHRQEKR